MRARLNNYRTPDDVFFDPAIRIPRREPDESFAYLFFDLVEGGRIVGNNGVQVEGRIYRLGSLQKHLEYWGERVDVRMNPDDQRVAMIFDQRTGAYVCKALVDAQDATYDTRDEVTRQLIARVFSDGKHLQRMAKDYTDGARERLAEYKRAKIGYLTRRARENDAARSERRAALTTTPPVTVIGSLSAAARGDEAAHPIELTASAIAEVLDADAAEREFEAVSGVPLCVVSTRKREAKVSTERRRYDGALRYKEIANRLGTTASSLKRYRDGVSPWPEGMKERYEEYVRIRAMAPRDTTALPLPAELMPAKPRRTRVDGELTYENIAKAIGIDRKMLDRCRKGKRSWPEGTKERYEEFAERRRLASAGR